MKRYFNCYILILLCSLLFSTPALSFDKKADKKARKAEQFIEITSMVQGKKFKFEATKCFPQSQSVVSIVSSQNFTIINDSIASARMPFFGEAYVSGYAQDGPIVYDAKMNDVEIVVNDKKSSVKMSYKVRGETDTYDVSVVVYYNGVAKMYIRSNNRSSVSYDGTITLLK